MTLPNVLKTIDYIDRTDDTLVLRISNEERGRLVLQMGTSDAGRAVRVAQVSTITVISLQIETIGVVEGRPPIFETTKRRAF